VLAQELALLAEFSEIPPLKQIGVLLLGDFYAAPALTERGAHGNVEPVWHAFAERFRWVVGIAGNHDVFPNFADWHVDHNYRFGNRYFLDGSVVTVDGLKIAGIRRLRN